MNSPDRLSRSTTDLLSLVEDLKGKGVAVEFVGSRALNIDTPQGAFMLTILAAVTQFERAVIRERQAEGIAIAKTNDVYEGEPKLTGNQVFTASELGVSRQTLYTALKAKCRYGDDEQAQS